jgi:hypothetical protein
MIKKDKAEILDEVWTEERVRSFLDLVPPTGINADFHALYTAYKCMRLDNFEEFVDFFAQAKRNFDATNQNGETVLDIIKQHRQGTDYAAALENGRSH